MSLDLNIAEPTKRGLIVSEEINIVDLIRLAIEKKDIVSLDIIYTYILNDIGKTAWEKFRQDAEKNVGKIVKKNLNIKHKLSRFQIKEKMQILPILLDDSNIKIHKTEVVDKIGHEDEDS